MNHLDTKLEKAFINLKNSTENAIIISHLQSADKNVNIFLIAKQPGEDIYYGILEDEFIEKKEIVGIPSSNFEILEVREIPIKPFWSKPYIEHNIKIYTELNLIKLFYENKDFREKIILLHHTKSKEYIASKSDELLFALGLSTGSDSIPLCIATTKKVNNYSISEDGIIKYEYHFGSLNLPSYLNIVDLFPLLSSCCYKSKDNSHLLQKMKESNNGQLLAFRDTLMAKASPDKLNELVKLLNQPEANPEIDNNENVTNLNILVLNKGTYECIFKNQITDEILKSYNYNIDTVNNTEDLNNQYKKVEVVEKLSKDKSVDIYANFLITNLEDTFYQLNNPFDKSSIQAIQGITFPFRDINIDFSIEIFNNDYKGKYSCWCPELVGCITEGNSKIEALNNLCFAIAEVLILNYDYLKINPLKKYGITPKVTKDYFDNETDIQSYSYSKILFDEFGFSKFYLGKKHLLLKNSNDKDITLTLPYQGFQQLTKHLIENTANQLSISYIEKPKKFSNEEIREILNKSIEKPKKYQNPTSLPDEELF